MPYYDEGGAGGGGGGGSPPPSPTVTGTSDTAGHTSFSLNGTASGLEQVAIDLSPGGVSYQVQAGEHRVTYSDGSSTVTSVAPPLTARFTFATDMPGGTERLFLAFNAGSGFSQSGQSLLFGGQTIATISGGGFGQALEIDFSGGGATPQVAAGVLDAVTYLDGSDTPAPVGTILFGFQDAPSAASPTGAIFSSTLQAQVAPVNDPPVLAAPLTLTASEGGAATIGALSGASDPDGNALSVVNIPANLPTGVTYDAATQVFRFDAANGAYDHLAAGQSQVVTVNYGVSDGALSVAQSVTFTAVGTNDAPVVSSAVTGAASEGGAVVSVDALAGASDVDDGASLSVVGVPASLPAGVTYDAATHRFSLNPADGAFDHLAAGQIQQVTVAFGVSDGIATTSQSATFTVVGANDAPTLGAQASELVANGGFEQGGVGWTNASGAGVETNPAGVYGVSGATGRVMEVDVNGGAPADDIAQTVATTAGGAYVFSFDAAARSGFSPATGAFQVVWNGVVIDTVTPPSTAMQHYSYTVMGNGETGTLEFRETGASDGVGGIVDNVSLVKAIVETAGQSGSSGLDAGSTTLSFTDVDLTDVHGVAVGVPSLVLSAGAAPAGLAASLAGALSTAVTEAGGAGSVVASFAAPDATFDFLAAGQTLRVTYAVTVSDGHGGVASQPVSFLVVGSNDGPTLVAAGATVTGGVAELADGAPGETTALLSASGVVAFADLDLSDTHMASFTANGPGYVGAFALGATDQAGDKVGWSFSVPDGALDSLAAGQQRVQAYTVKVDDGHGGSVTQVVTVTLTGANDAPVAHADVAATTENQALTVDVLANDTDVDLGATATLVSVATPAGKGAVSIVDGKLVFTPGADFDHLSAGATETVTLSYVMKDDQGATASSTVLLTVTGANDAPVVSAPLTAGAVEAAGPVRADALAGAADVDDGATLSVVDVPADLPAGVTYDAASHSFSLDPANAAYDHLAAGQTQAVSVAFGVSDGTATAAQSITFTVTGANDAPVVSSALAAGATEAGAAVGVDALAGASDVDDGAVLSVVDAPAVLPAGVSYDAASHRFSLDPANAAYDHLAAGQTQQVVVAFGVSDGLATTAQSVTFTVTGANDAPVAAADAAATTENQAVTVDVLANDTDVDDGAAKTLVSVLAPTGKGAASIVDGKLVFTPGADFDHLSAGATERVTLSYVMKDDQGATATSTVLVTVTGANDAPVVAGVVSGAATEDGAPSTLDARAMASDVDDGTTLTAVGLPATLPAGVTYDAASQTFSLAGSDAAYQHLGLGQSQVVTVAYGVSDGSVTTAASVSWTVSGTNDAPVAHADAGVVDENGSLTLNVLGNDTDVDDGDTRTISAVGATALGGQVTILDGKIVYVANDDSFDLLTPGQSVVDTFSYTVRDTAGASSTATVSVTVRGVADGPDLVGGNQSQSLVGTALDERIFGGNAEDTLSGGAGADKLYGGNGKDLLIGGSGRDQLYGENGSDTLDGGLGNDTLTGGNGGDVFLFGANSGKDIVTDFGNGDVLKFVGVGFTSSADALAHASSVSGGVLISLSGGNSVLLQGISLSSLSTSDFLIG